MLDTTGKDIFLNIRTVKIDMGVENSPETHEPGTILEDWEALRHGSTEEALEAMCLKYEGVLRPILDLTETAPHVWSSPENFDDYLDDVGQATGEVMLQIVPSPDQEGVRPEKLFSLFTEVANVPPSAYREALTELLYREEICAKNGWFITRAPEQ